MQVCIEVPGSASILSFKAEMLYKIEVQLEQRQSVLSAGVVVIFPGISRRLVRLMQGAKPEDAGFFINCSRAAT